MPTQEHLLVKPQKIAETGIGMVTQDLVVPRLFRREGIERFKGSEGDTVSVKVPGVLPYRRYAWRNDRSAPIQFDRLVERKVPVTFGDNLYSAVKVTDEQYEMDLSGWAQLLEPQTRALGRGLEQSAINALETAPYVATIGLGGSAVAGRSATIEARKLLNRFNAPNETRYLLVGSDFEAMLLNDKNITFAQAGGDAIANSALAEAILGRLSGFTVLSSNEITPTSAYAFVASGFLMMTAAPSVPQSVPFGASVSYDGISMRWVRDYNTEYMEDRSVVNLYPGFATTKDVLVGFDTTNNVEKISTSEYFVRGVKLTLAGTSTYPADTSEVAQITGVKSTGKYVAPTA